MLPDINLWLALAFERHAHHAAAKGWFDALAAGRCHFCRLTQQGFLRLATNPRVMGVAAVPMKEAWTLYDTFMSDDRIQFAEEPLGRERTWRTYTNGQTFSPKVWNDAYLAAFGHAASLTLVTFDNGFTQYHDLRPVILA